MPDISAAEAVPLCNDRPILDARTRKALNSETGAFSVVIARIRRMYPEAIADRILARMHNGATFDDAEYATYDALFKLIKRNERESK